MEEDIGQPSVLSSPMVTESDGSASPDASKDSVMSSPGNSKGSSVDARDRIAALMAQQETASDRYVYAASVSSSKVGPAGSVSDYSCNRYSAERINTDYSRGDESYDEDEEGFVNQGVAKLVGDEASSPLEALAKIVLADDISPLEAQREEILLKLRQNDLQFLEMYRSPCIELPSYAIKVRADADIYALGLEGDPADLAEEDTALIYLDCVEEEFDQGGGETGVRYNVQLWGFEAPFLEIFRTRHDRKRSFHRIKAYGLQDFWLVFGDVAVNDLCIMSVPFSERPRHLRITSDMDTKSLLRFRYGTVHSRISRDKYQESVNDATPRDHAVLYNILYDLSFEVTLPNPWYITGSSFLKHVPRVRNARTTRRRQK